MFDDYSYVYVEDDQLSREVTQMIFENAMGVERLWIFEDSDNFVQRVKALPSVPDIFLLDIYMSPLSGFEILKMIRSDDELRQSLVVALTASVMSDEVELIKSAGFDGAIGKPLSVTTFPDLIRRILKGEEIWYIPDDT
ncbi:MAG: response regulator [Chloroflexi bacterium]|nr:response regulator [Chloroflexota bacterium]